MVKLPLNTFLILIIVSLSYGTLFLNYEEDLRGTYIVNSKLQGEINSLSGSIRQVFSDKKGDRVILYMQGELEHNFSENMIHQLYAKYKGPMGKWNISLGRIPLPWGLLTAWSPERMPYSSPYKVSGILKADNGIMVNGTVGMMDYGIAITQGFGMERIHSFPGPGLGTARISISPLLSGDLTVGLSGSYGTSYRSIMGHHHESEPIEHLTFALDVTAFIGRGTIRLESGGENVDDDWKARGFLETDYQLLPKLKLHAAGTLITDGDNSEGTIFAGLSTILKSITIRGGYEYEKRMEDKQTIVLQLYRQFSYSR